MRCFLAIDLNDTLKENIEELQSRLVKLTDMKKTELENLHFTLKFFGEVNEKEVTNIVKEMKNIASGTKRFTISLGSLGAFPSLTYIRIVYLGIKKNIELSNLQKSINTIFGSSKKDDIPHLTIARVKSSRNDTLKAFIEKTSFSGEMAVRAVVLKKSTLTPKGPVYGDIAVFRFEV